MIVFTQPRDSAVYVFRVSGKEDGGLIRENQKLLNVLHVVVDAAIIAISFLLAYQLRFDDTWSPLIKYEIIPPPIGYYRSFEEYRNMLIMLIPVYLIIYNMCGMYDSKRTSGRRAELYRLIKSSIFGMFYTVAILYFLLKESDYARLFLGLFVLLNITIDYAFRLALIKILRNMRKAGKNLKHVLLVGYSRTAQRYIDRLRAHPEWGYSIHGMLDDNKQIGESYKNVKVVGRIDSLRKLLSSNEYDEIAITLGIDEYGKLEKIVEICEKSGVHTKFVPDYNNIVPTKPYTEDLDGIPVIHVRHVPLSSSFNKVLKRGVDILGSIVALVIFAVPMAASAAIIKITSPGPLIFKQKRIGFHNREFQIYKFRSMDVQEEGAEKKAWTTENDPRVTKFGRFMRKTNIDELPQLVNVLKGDMSLVGPRPERPYFVNKFKEEIPRYMIKHQVRPGMTGWAQVNGYRGDTSITKRIECDLYYVENWSMMLDFKILFLTFFGHKVNKNAY